VSGNTNNGIHDRQMKPFCHAVASIVLAIE